MNSGIIRVEVIEMYGYTQQQQAPGQWLMVNSYQDVQRALLPMDGSQMMFMMKNEPIFYIASIVNGQKCIQPYTFQELTPENMPKQPPTVEERVQSLESNLADIVALLKGMRDDESNIQTKTNEPAGEPTAVSK